MMTSPNALGATMLALFLVLVLLASTSTALDEPTCRSSVDVKNKALLESLYGMFGRGEFRKLMEHVDDNIKWVVGQDTPNTAVNTPWYGVYNGKQEVMRFFETHANHLNALKFSISDFTFSEDGNTITLRFDITYESKETKKKANFMELHRMTFRDSKVIEFYSKFDTLGGEQLQEAITTQELRNVVRLFLDAINRHDSESAAKMISSDAKCWAPLGPNQPLSKEEWKKSLDNLLVSFPDAQFTVDHVVADATTSLVTLRYHVTGTHMGTYLGIPATQRRVKWQVSATLHVAATAPGSYVLREWWMDIDRFALLSQIGGIQLPNQMRS